MDKDQELREIDVYDEKGHKLKGIVLFTFEEAGDTFICYSVDEEIFFSKLKEDNSLEELEDDEYEIVEKIWKDFSTSDKFKKILNDFGYEGIDDSDEILEEIKDSYKDVEISPKNKKREIN